MNKLFNVMDMPFLNVHKFLTNRFVGNFIQLTYKTDMCPLNIWKAHKFFY
jgi:hypothetical protein